MCASNQISTGVDNQEPGTGSSKEGERDCSALKRYRNNRRRVKCEEGEKGKGGSRGRGN